MSDRTAELADGLERVLEDRTGAPVTVRDLTRLSGGASR